MYLFLAVDFKKIPDEKTCGLIFSVILNSGRVVFTRIISNFTQHAKTITRPLPRLL